MATQSTSNNTNWTAAILNALLQGTANYKAAQEQKKVSQAAAKPTTTYTSKTPYGNAYISQLLPYLFGEGVNIYQTLSAKNGRNAGNIDLSKIFANVPQGYQGVGGVMPYGAASYGNGPDTSNSFNYGSSSGNGSGGGEGIYSDMASRGSSLDSMLTPEQRAQSAYHLTNEDMHNVLSGLGGAAKNTALGIMSGYGGPIGGLIGLLSKAFEGKSGHGENKLLASLPKKLEPYIQHQQHYPNPGIDSPDHYYDANGNLIPREKLPNDHFTYNGLDPRQLDFYNGTSNPWDWGNDSYRDNGLHNTGGNWGGGGAGGFGGSTGYGGGDIWSMFRGSSY